MKGKSYNSTFKYTVIYVFSIEDERHKGLLKIGETTIDSRCMPDQLFPNCKILNDAAKTRIAQFTKTAGIKFDLQHTELGISYKLDENNKPVIVDAISDRDVHDVLKNSNIKNIKKKNKNDQYWGNEWFEVDLETVKNAIDAAKNHKNNLSGSLSDDISIPIVFRPEQEDAITKTIRVFKKDYKMLWNAKMRFGKTLSALEVIKRGGFKKSIIITHRPVVDEGWYTDFEKIFKASDNYQYGSKKSGYTEHDLTALGDKFVYFASIQDLRGSKHVGGKHIKNKSIFETKWDLVIVDEAHEGTTTALGDEVIKNIVKHDLYPDTKFLALSGTPFNILENYDETNIFTWDYIMEQSCKNNWDKEHFGDHNPYIDLPKMNIYTFDLNNILKNSELMEFEDQAFNFTEFFRVQAKGAITKDQEINKDTELEFCHEKDVTRFLDLLTESSKDSNYPYSNQEFRNLFRHSLWMVPGVKEAKTLKALMSTHPVFGQEDFFHIINVAGDGDEEAKNALEAVKGAISKCGEDEYTITLSCGRLTTGVTVPEWTAVFMLAGSYYTTASSYLQTIFRVQSPCITNGKLKTDCYVFDFAPDRTLKMVAKSVAISGKAGKTRESDRKILGEFLNYCPVISVSGTKMEEFNTDRLLQQLKDAYVERVVQSGFDDAKLYNDELLKLDDIALEEFDGLEKIIKTTNALPRIEEIDINRQGLTNEEYDEIEKIKSRPKKELTEEEKKRLEELKSINEQRKKAISILRGISIRMPLLIYGADIPFDDDITIDRFSDDDFIDDTSWKEFMPPGVTKEEFKKFTKYYDKDIFIASGRKIRRLAKAADDYPVEERVKRIAHIFDYFRNPDKETVLTPWRVVNMHMSDCLGGYDFFDEQHQKPIKNQRLVDHGKITSDTFKNADAKILEINSKTGLYPLYAAFSIYKAKCAKIDNNQLNDEKRQELWKETISNNIYVICNTTMARQITTRTLVGYKNAKINAHYFVNLADDLGEGSERSKLINQVLKPSFWKKDFKDTMNFNAVIGNPPYQEETGTVTRQSVPLYIYFFDFAKNLNPNYISMITPSRWLCGGMKKLDGFRNTMKKDKRIRKLYDYANSEDCFSNISIDGGVCYFLWDCNYSGDCLVTNIVNKKVKDTSLRNLDELEDLIVRDNKSVSIIRKVKKIGKNFIDTIVNPLDYFGLPTKFRGNPQYTEGDCIVYSSKGIGYTARESISKGQDLISAYKIIIGKKVSDHALMPNKKDGFFHIFTGTMKVLGPNEVCTHSYFTIGPIDNKELAENLLKYLKTKFVRFLVWTTLTSGDLSRQRFIFVPFLDFNQKWDDTKLYNYFKLTNDEISYIESIIK